MYCPRDSHTTILMKINFNKNLSLSLFQITPTWIPKMKDIDFDYNSDTWVLTKFKSGLKSQNPVLQGK